MPKPTPKPITPLGIVVAVGMVVVAGFAILRAVQSTPAATPAYTPAPTLISNYDITDADYVTAAPGTIHYAHAPVAVYDCPRTDCQQLGTLTVGTSLLANNYTDGEDLGEGPLWVNFAYQGYRAYVYPADLKLVPSG